MSIDGPNGASASVQEWRDQARLDVGDLGGDAAYGLIAPLTALLRRAPQLERAAPARHGLMLRLSGRMAVLWSAEPPALPWLGDDARYLGAPDQRVFTPIGAQIALRRALFSPWLAMLEREYGLAPPLLLAPSSALGDVGSALTALDLRDSAPLAAVDWARLRTRAVA